MHFPVLKTLVYVFGGVQETEDMGTEAPAKGGSSLPNQSEESKIEPKEIETPLVPCRMEPLNASPSHSEDETEEGGLASEKDDDDDVEDVEEMEATPVQVKDSDSEETIGKGTCSASFSLDEMMDIGTVDQQEQEAQMCTDDNNRTTGINTNVNRFIFLSLEEGMI